MVDATIVSLPLLLISDDRALIRLIRLECRELALGLEVAATLPSHGEEHTLLIDLDSISTTDVYALGEQQTAAGICRDVSALPPEIKARFSQLLQRPFPTSQLRALLGRLCGRAGMLSDEQNETRMSRLPRGRALPSASEISLIMQSDTELLCGEDVIRLSPTERAIMQLLIAHRGETVSRELLETCLTGESGTSSNKIEVYLCFLRRKIERPLGLRLITTVRGKGYRLE